MTREREQERAGTPAQEVWTDGAIPPPSPEEVPELLGERSDYPAPFGDEEAPEPGGARREDEPRERPPEGAPE